jgi:hypothetical protein
MNQDSEQFNILDRSFQDGSFFRNPHIVYEKLRLKYPILWCDHKNGFYITTKTYIEFILNNCLISKRITSSITNIVDTTTRLKVTHFVSKWPFYRNDNYKEDKMKSQKFINSNIGNLVDLIKNYDITRDNTNLVSSLFNELSLKCLLVAMNLNLENYEDIIYYGKYIIKFMQNDLAEAEEYLLLSCIDYFNDLYSKYRNKDIIEYGIFCNLLIDGHEPVTNILTYATIMYADNFPLENQYIKGFVNEILRFFPSFQYLVRYADDDIYIENYYIPSGSKLYLVIASANRDENVCENYGNFNYKRLDNDTNLSFGKGSHSCMGNKLAYEILLNFVKKLVAENRRVNFEYNSVAVEPFTGTFFVSNLQGTIR